MGTIFVASNYIGETLIVTKRKQIFKIRITAKYAEQNNWT